MINAVLVDVDGTLTNTDHRKHFLERKPKDWDGWHAAARLDTVHADIRSLVRLLATTKAIVVVSGRGEEQRDLTKALLQSNDIPYLGLYMRPFGDRRPDDVVKRELLAQIRADGFNPVMALDDRDRVVAMWRAEGIRCLQVAPGNF